MTLMIIKELRGSSEIVNFLILLRDHEQRATPRQ